MGGDLRAVLVSSEADAGVRVARALERASDGLSVTAADASTDGLDLVAADCLVVDADHPPPGLLGDIARTPGVNDLPVVFAPDAPAGEAGGAVADGDAAYASLADRVARTAERQRRTQELHRRNERLEEFASVVSHDLRSPLTVAKGRIDLATAECDSDHLGHATAALDRMSDLIDDVLRFARADSELRRRRPVSLPEMARAAWRTSGAGRGTLTVDDDLGTVEGDETRLRQLFENLFRNSVEHGSTNSRALPDGSAKRGSANSRAQSGDAVEHGSTSGRAEPDASVEHRATESEADAVPGAERGAEGDAPPDGVASYPVVRVRVGTLTHVDGFYVADDGPGVPPEVRDRAFESGVTTVAGGTGFGLAIVRRIAVAHGWDVSLAESDCGGARFEFSGVQCVDAE